jgi:hypothetical protein
MTTALFLASLLLAPTAGAVDRDAALPKAQVQAQDSVDAARKARVERRKELERLRKDLRYVAEALDRETVGAEGDEKTLDELSKGGLGRLKELRATGGLDPKLAPALDRLEALYAGLPAKTYAKEYAVDLAAAVAEELRQAASEPSSEEELLSRLQANLSLPAAMPGDADVEDLAFFPVDVPLAKFKKLGAIRIFLMKHRLKRPGSHAKTTAAAIIAGRHNVQVGVEVEGTVTAIYKAIDQDFCFDFGALHIEMTPEWRLLHPKIHKPKVGERVRVKGWTYFDVFHKAEFEYDPQDPVMGVNRATQWEIHPVQDVEPLP